MIIQTSKHCFFSDFKMNLQKWIRFLSQLFIIPQFVNNRQYSLWKILIVAFYVNQKTLNILNRSSIFCHRGRRNELGEKILAINRHQLIDFDVQNWLVLNQWIAINCNTFIVCFMSNFSLCDLIPSPIFGQ